jgi:hypothetical protein
MDRTDPETFARPHEAFTKDNEILLPYYQESGHCIDLGSA